MAYVGRLFTHLVKKKLVLFFNVKYKIVYTHQFLLVSSPALFGGIRVCAFVLKDPRNPCMRFREENVAFQEVLLIVLVKQLFQMLLSFEKCPMLKFSQNKTPYQVKGLRDLGHAYSMKCSRVENKSGFASSRKLI